MMFRKSVPVIAFAVMAAFSSVSSAGAQELTTNGGFETGTFAGWTQFPTGAGQQTVTTVNPVAGVFAGDINNTVAPSNSLFKQANIGIGLVSPGQLINISFDARGTFGTGGVAFAEFFSEIAGGGTSKTQILGGGPLAVNANPNIWTHFVFSTTAGPNVSGGVTLQLGAATGAINGSTARLWIDNASVSINTVNVSGSVALQGLQGSGIVGRFVEFQFRPLDGSPRFTQTIPLGVDGTFNMTGIPPKSYTLNIKGRKYLAKNVNVNTTNGSVSGVLATLQAGDANNDNAVDISDLLLLIAHYNEVSPSTGYLEAADFNFDGTNDIADLLLLIGSYNQLGD